MGEAYHLELQQSQPIQVHPKLVESISLLKPKHPREFQPQHSSQDAEVQMNSQLFSQYQSSDVPFAWCTKNIIFKCLLAQFFQAPISNSCTKAADPDFAFFSGIIILLTGFRRNNFDVNTISIWFYIPTTNPPLPINKNWKSFSIGTAYKHTILCQAITCHNRGFFMKVTGENSIAEPPLTMDVRSPPISPISWPPCVIITPLGSVVEPDESVCSHGRSGQEFEDLSLLLPNNISFADMIRTVTWYLKVDSIATGLHTLAMLAMWRSACPPPLCVGSGGMVGIGMTLVLRHPK
nr:hypothetical protein Iba_chr07bCG10140 [Ipomoea batatas]